jgi:hypothetical protein
LADLYPQWSAAKADFAKSKGLFPDDFLDRLVKGAGFGPALKTLDKAKSYDDRAKAVASVRTAKLKYEGNIRALIKEVNKKDSAAHKALDRFEKNLQDIWEQADKLGQPPRPSGSTVPHDVVRSFNLGGGFKPKHLDLKATKIDIIIEVDKTLEALIKAGEESLKIDALGDVAKQELDKVSDAFAQTMKDIDAKIELLDPAKRDKQIKEANEVLKHYSKTVEDRIDEAVQKEWKSYLSRKQYLSDFRLKCGVKIALGVVAIGISAASIALSFGTLWINIVGIVKSITDIARTIKTWAADLETVYAGLVKDMDDVQQLNVQRETAKQKGEGQKASKAAGAAKEVITGLLPITKNMLKSASDVDARAKQMLGLVSKLETQADKLVGQLNAAVKMMDGLPEKDMTAALRKQAKSMEDTFTKLFAEITDLHKKSQNCAHFGERSLKAVEKLRKEDSWSGGAAETTVGIGAKGAALFALANFSYECAKQGATLLSAL